MYFCYCVFLAIVTLRPRTTTPLCEFNNSLPHRALLEKGLGCHRRSVRPDRRVGYATAVSLVSSRESKFAADPKQTVDRYDVCSIPAPRRQSRSKILPSDA